MTPPKIEPTDEMERAMVYGGPTRERLAAVLAIVERDYRIEPRPPWERVVHQAIIGDGHVHCCGQSIGTLPTGERWTYDPHGATCKGPS